LIIDIDTIGYFLFMEEQERRENDNQEEAEEDITQREVV